MEVFYAVGKSLRPWLISRLTYLPVVVDEAYDGQKTSKDGVAGKGHVVIGIPCKSYF